MPHERHISSRAKLESAFRHSTSLSQMSTERYHATRAVCAWSDAPVASHGSCDSLSPLVEHLAELLVVRLGQCFGLITYQAVDSRMHANRSPYMSLAREKHDILSLSLRHGIVYVCLGVHRPEQSLHGFTKTRCGLRFRHADVLRFGHGPGVAETPHLVACLDVLGEVAIPDARISGRGGHVDRVSGGLLGRQSRCLRCMTSI